MLKESSLGGSTPEVHTFKVFSIKEKLKKLADSGI